MAELQGLGLYSVVRRTCPRNGPSNSARCKRRCWFRYMPERSRAAGNARSCTIPKPSKWSTPSIGISRGSGKGGGFSRVLCGAPCSTCWSRRFCATIRKAPWSRSAAGSTRASNGSTTAASTGSTSTCRTRSSCGRDSSATVTAARLWPRRFSIRTGSRQCGAAPGHTSSSRKLYSSTWRNGR